MTTVVLQYVRRTVPLSLPFPLPFATHVLEDIYRLAFISGVLDGACCVCAYAACVCVRACVRACVHGWVRALCTVDFIQHEEHTQYNYYEQRYLVETPIANWDALEISLTEHFGRL